MTHCFGLFLGPSAGAFGVTAALGAAAFDGPAFDTALSVTAGN